jgi:ABC-2 type transport system permease protein
MRNTLTVAWKEIRTYFASPMAYIVAMVFLALTGYFFAASISQPFPEATIRGFLGPSIFILILLAPVLTMRLFAEEQKLGTIELLLTAPVRDWEVVLGKFLASLAFFVGTIALTLYYVLLLYWYGDPDAGPLLSGYLGLILYGAATLSIGLFVSSLTNNQIVAAVVGFGLLLALSIIHQAAGLVSGVASTIFTQLSLATHFDDFARGVVDTSGVIYYVSVAALFLFLTVRSLETRRWR